MEIEEEDLKLTVYAALSKEHLENVKQFVSYCAVLDKFESPFHWESIEKRKNPGVNDILCSYQGVMVAYFALYYFEPHEIEVTFLIHPEYRIRELYTSFWEYVSIYVRQKFPVSIARYTFTIHEKAEYSLDFLKTLGAKKMFASYKLQLLRDKQRRGVENEGIFLRQALINDVPALVKAQVECFSVDKETYENHLNILLADPKQAVWVALQGRDFLGKLHVKYENKNAFIYDFCVIPEEQNRGYGTFILNKAISELFNNKKIDTLSVEASSLHALKWYQKFGFTIAATYEHWQLEVSTFH